MTRIVRNIKIKGHSPLKIPSSWMWIPRADEPNELLEKKAVELLAVIVDRLRKEERLEFNNQHLSRIAKCKVHESISLLKQLTEVLDISFNVSLVVNGRKYENINVVKHREDMIEKLDPHAYFMRKK